MVGVTRLGSLLYINDIGAFKPLVPLLELISSKTRYRFIRMASDKSNASRVVVFSDPASPAHGYAAAAVPVAKLNEEIMDAAFVKAVATDSYPGGLAALERDHRFGETVPLGKHWSYKYLIDMDGMSYSGRFLSFLASDSVPLKSTVYEEFFSDWIQPWYSVLCIFDLFYLNGSLPGFISFLFLPRIEKYTIFMLISRVLRNQHWKLLIRHKQEYFQSYERRRKQTDGYAESQELERHGSRILVGLWIWKVNYLLLPFI